MHVSEVQQKEFKRLGEIRRSEQAKVKEKSKQAE